jgi:hypothetical protein
VITVYERGAAVAILGTLLKNKRAGETNLAWNLPALAGPETLTLRSPDFEHGTRASAPEARTAPPP